MLAAACSGGKTDRAESDGGEPREATADGQLDTDAARPGASAAASQRDVTHFIGALRELDPAKRCDLIARKLDRGSSHAADLELIWSKVPRGPDCELVPVRALPRSPGVARVRVGLGLGLFEYVDLELARRGEAVVVGDIGFPQRGAWISDIADELTGLTPDLQLELVAVHPKVLQFGIDSLEPHVASSGDAITPPDVGAKFLEGLHLSPRAVGSIRYTALVAAELSGDERAVEFRDALREVHPETLAVWQAQATVHVLRHEWEALERHVDALAALEPDAAAVVPLMHAALKVEQGDRKGARDIIESTIQKTDAGPDRDLLEEFSAELRVAGTDADPHTGRGQGHAWLWDYAWPALVLRSSVSEGLRELRNRHAQQVAATVRGAG